jgi:hypothetical protein
LVGKIKVLDDVYVSIIKSNLVKCLSAHSVVMAAKTGIRGAMDIIFASNKSYEI